MSFAKLMQRFKGGVCTDDKPPQQQDPLRLATAAVLLDIGYADGTLSREEDEDLVTYLKRTFALDDTMAQELVKAAAEIRAQTIDHFALTHFIRRNATGGVLRKTSFNTLLVPTTVMARPAPPGTAAIIADHVREPA